MPKTIKHSPTYKYRLYDLLFKKYGTDYLSGKEHIAKEVVRMSISTVNMDFGIRGRDKKKIPHPRLVLYAEHFGVEVDSLLISPKKKKVN